MTIQATDRKALADRLEKHARALAHLGWASADLRQAAAILRQEPSIEDLTKFLYPVIAGAADFNAVGFAPYDVAASEPHGDPWVNLSRETAQAIAALYGGRG